MLIFNRDVVCIFIFLDANYCLNCSVGYFQFKLKNNHSGVGDIKVLILLVVHPTATWNEKTTPDIFFSKEVTRSMYHQHSQGANGTHFSYVSTIWPSFKCHRNRVANLNTYISRYPSVPVRWSLMCFGSLSGWSATNS